MVVPKVVIPDTLILFVLILSVAATPVNADPSPVIDVTVTAPNVDMLAFIFPPVSYTHLRAHET